MGNVLMGDGRLWKACRIKYHSDHFEKKQSSTPAASEPVPTPCHNFPGQSWTCLCPHHSTCSSALSLKGQTPLLLVWHNDCRGLS